MVKLSLKKNIKKFSPGVINLFTIPNYITFLRIILIPFYLFFFTQGDIFIAAVLFSISALTDFLDGFIARKYKLQSSFGKLLDPLADKLTIVSILFVLIHLKLISGAIAYIILARELFILFSGIITYIFGLNFINPTLIGKLSIALLYLAISLRVLGVDYFGDSFFYLVIPVTIISAIDYSFKAYKKIFK